MDIERLIGHPELMDRDTLYDLRSKVALYPYWQTARLLMLENLFLLHDVTFDDELRRAAIYITDRSRLFRLVEAAHYKIGQERQEADRGSGEQPGKDGNRTISLIDHFLEQMPADKEGGAEAAVPAATTKTRRRPTAADATTDYVAYLLEMEEAGDGDGAADGGRRGPGAGDRTTAIIDNFIDGSSGKIELSSEPSPAAPVVGAPSDTDELPDEGFFTETLARIYVKQGHYSKALAIIKRLDLNYPGKNPYFADQIRFLEKLVINSNKKPKA